MQNLVALTLMVPDKKIFKVFIFFSVLLPWQPVFDGIKFFHEIQKRTMAGTFLRNFIKIRLVVSEKMFKEKVSGQMDGRTDGLTTDNRP